MSTSARGTSTILIGRTTSGHRRKAASTGAGRTTDGAGIGLTPAAAKAIRLPGKGKVDWEFIVSGLVAEAVEEKVEEATDASTVLLEQALALLRKIEQLPAQPQKPEHLQKVIEVASALLADAARRPLLK